MSAIDILKEKAIFLNNLSSNEERLIAYINSDKLFLEEVIQKYQPQLEFRPVNTLRFLIAIELSKGNYVGALKIEELKSAIENRQVLKYHNFNEAFIKSLNDYKNSKLGMFPNWSHSFKILFPFIHSASENEEVKKLLHQLSDEIIHHNNLKEVTKHIVSFQGSQNYGSDRVWVGIIPKSAPSVQYAYQIFYAIDLNGLTGGIHKGHNLLKQEFLNEDEKFETWNEFLKKTEQRKDKWYKLNNNVNFIFINDEKDFIKCIKKTDVNSLNTFFKALDNLIKDLEIVNEENLVFSLGNNQFSFQVGKRFCVNLKKDKFSFITPDSYNIEHLDKELFTSPDNALLYKDASLEDFSNHFEAIKNAVESEIERDSHTEPKNYDNSAFRKASFDINYRNKIMNIRYWALGFSTDYSRLENFKEQNFWSALDYGVNDNSSAAKIARRNFKQIKIGDKIIIKGYGGSHDLKIHYKGVVIKKDEKEYKLEFNKIDDNLYKGKAPKGKNGGNWQSTILEVKRLKDINLLFYGLVEETIKQEFINWMIAKSKPNYFQNDFIKWEEYLEEAMVHFNVNLFNPTSSNYQDIIDLIEETMNSNKELFFKSHKAKDSGKLAAILGKENYQKFLVQRFNDIDQNTNTVQMYKAKINQILYGPPGTGKTYNTILEASKIISNNENMSYDEAQIIFNDNLGSKIEFLTFHQNYSYEDFIQGLRPDVEQKELSFNRTDGIFTKIATNALFEYYKLLQKNQVDSNNNSDLKIDLNDAYIEFLGSLQKGQEFETKTGAKIKIDNFTDRQNIEFKPLNGIKSYLVSGSRLLKLHSVFKNIDDIKNVNEDIRNVIGGCNSTMYYVALREFISFLKEYENTLTEFVDKEVDYDYDNITYNRKKELLSNIELSELRKISNDEVPKYVIIIDEINRANISRVFGELITLIEKDKRSHGDLPIKAKLPSGEQFIVPSNLYIIGTMNTADKSIALLDIALRRRFEFVPKYPLLQILKNDENLIKRSDILDKLNKEIINKKGHDFTIGHSYFMGSDFTLKNTINNKVIPLLLEYFMNDVDEVKNILNAAGLAVDGWPMKLVAND